LPVVENPKKDNKFLVILIIIVAVFAVGIGVIFMMSNNQTNSAPSPINTISNETPEPTTTPTPTETSTPTSEVDEESQKIITTITNDVSFIITGLNQYMSNNRGNVPTVGGTGTRNWDYFIDNYIDYDYGSEVNVHYREIYRFTFCTYDEGTCPDPLGMTWAKDNHVLVFATKTNCAGNSIALYDSVKRVAVYTVLPDNTIVCKNN
jgi:hypothetical protein